MKLNSKSFNLEAKYVYPRVYFNNITSVKYFYI